MQTNKQTNKQAKNRKKKEKKKKDISTKFGTNLLDGFGDACNGQQTDGRLPPRDNRSSNAVNQR